MMLWLKQRLGRDKKITISRAVRKKKRAAGKAKAAAPFPYEEKFKEEHQL